MRTTVNIADGLLETAKGRARERGQTLGDFVEAALQDYVSRPGPDRSRARDLPVFEGKLGIRPGVDMTTNAGLYEAMYADEDEALLRERT